MAYIADPLRTIVNLQILLNRDNKIISWELFLKQTLEFDVVKIISRTCEECLYWPVFLEGYLNDNYIQTNMLQNIYSNITLSKNKKKICFVCRHYQKLFYIIYVLLWHVKWRKQADFRQSYKSCEPFVLEFIILVKVLKTCILAEYLHKMLACLLRS